MAADSAASTSATRASGSSFYTAMRILPRAQRDGMFEIYSFCRQVDDIADSEGPREPRLVELERWRADVNAMYQGRTGTSMAGLARAVRDFDLAREDFLAIIDGMEMDVRETIRAPDLATLDLYCDRVASAVGRLSVRVFGMERESGLELAHHLGRALQLTNILRGLDKDAGMGRLYLPREALQGAGIASTDPATVLRDVRVGAACHVVVEKARSHFSAADTIMARAPRRVVRAARIMGEVYRLILEGSVLRGWAAPREPVHIGRWHLLAIVLRFGLL